METYQDLKGSSGITAYGIGENENEGEYIDIQFRSGDVYRYLKRNVGIVKFEVMKALAEAGTGLCGFISKAVRKQYNSHIPNFTADPSFASALEVVGKILAEYDVEFAIFKTK